MCSESCTDNCDNYNAASHNFLHRRRLPQQQRCQPHRNDYLKRAQKSDRGGRHILQRCIKESVCEKTAAKGLECHEREKTRRKISNVLPSDKSTFAEGEHYASKKVREKEQSHLVRFLPFAYSPRDKRLSGDAGYCEKGPIRPGTDNPEKVFSPPTIPRYTPATIRKPEITCRAVGLSRVIHNEPRIVTRGKV